MLVFSLAVVNLSKVTTTLKKWGEKKKKGEKKRRGEEKRKEKERKRKKEKKKKRRKKKKKKGRKKKRRRKKKGQKEQEEKKKKKGGGGWWWFVFRLPRTIIVFWWVCKITVSLHSTFVTASVALIILILLALSNWDFAVETGQVCPFKIRCLHRYFDECCTPYFELTMLKTSLACLKISWGDECSVHVLLLMAHHWQPENLQLVEDVLSCPWRQQQGWPTLGDGVVRTLSGECTASLGWPWGVCQFGVWWTCTVALDDGDLNWEVLAQIARRGVVCCLWGECTASLGWPLGMCAVNQHSCIGMTIGNVCGEPAQLHLPPAIAMAPVGQQVGWCAHLEESARRPWAVHGVCVS